MDGAPEAGGRNLGMRPMEMILAGTGGCSAFDVVLILKKGRHAVSGCEVSLNAERAETDKSGQYSSARVHGSVTVNSDGTFNLHALEGLTPEVIQGF